MAKFQMGVTLSEDAFISARLGAGTGAGNNFTDAERGKAVKFTADSRFDLCVAGDPIEGFIGGIESATLDGYTFGSVQVEDRREVLADGLQATPGTGTIAVGDYVVAGTMVAKGTALDTFYRQRVCKATQQPGVTVPADLTAAAAQIKVSMYAWRVVAITSGTGVVGDVLIIERVNR